MEVKKIVVPTTSKLLFFSYEQGTNVNPSNSHTTARFCVIIFFKNMETGSLKILFLILELLKLQRCLYINHSHPILCNYGNMDNFEMNQINP